LSPPIEQIALIKSRAVIVTAKSKARGRDFAARFFAPRVGINEDPVAGSALCSLAPYWHRRLNKSRMSAMFCSPRLGVVDVELCQGKLKIGGTATIVAAGRFFS
jgi:predicted PhzF superfamily epimerase YddE/YHI9